MSVYGRFLAAALSLPQGGEWHPFKRYAAGAHPFKRQASAQHPFRALAGAQHPFDLQGGAWHPFAGQGVAFHPFVSASGGLHPFTPLAGGLHPFPEQSAASSDLLPGPWLGIDPGWVYGNADSLQAQAMRRVRTELTGLVVPPADAQADAHRPAVAIDRGDAIWRWGAEFRVKAIVGELAARVHADARGVMVVTDPARAALVGWRIGGDFQRDDWWDEQIDKVLRAAIEREDRLPEILTQLDQFWDYFAMVTGLNLAQAPRTAELLEVATEWATLIVMAMKNQLAVRRPMHRSQLVMPIIDTPSHGALPSGHATVARLYADLLPQLLYAEQQQRQRQRQLDVLARRIAFNRVVAGVHFQADSVAGHGLGRYLARCLIALAEPQPVPTGCTLEIAAGASLDERSLDEPAVTAGEKQQFAPALQWTKLWAAVREELAALRV
jgi:membrane-associated phospholipid phosphatase